MLWRVDPGSPQPLFEQLAASVRAEIARGAVGAGDRLPGARDVGASLGVHHHTVLKAYQELRDEGLVEMRPGRGAVVTGTARDIGQLQVRVADLVAKARDAGVGDETLVSLVRLAQREAVRS